MPDLGDGARRAMETVLSAIVISIFLKALSESSLMSRGLISLINVVSIFGIIILTKDMKYWGTGYLLGWSVGIIFGISIFLQSGLIGALDIVLYIAVTAVGLWLRFG